MPINEYGFLGKDIKQYENILVEKYKEVFDFYEDINHFLHKMRFKIDVKNDDFQGGTMVGLFSKSLTTFQAIYILFKHYLCNNAEELCRILFEEMVNIGYCSLGKDEVRRYLSLHYINQYRLNNIIYKKENEKYFVKNFKEEAFKDISYEDRKKDLIKKIEGLGIEDIFNEKGKPVPISLEERIKKIDSKIIMYFYLTFYRIISTGIHSSPEILDRYLKLNENDLIREICWGPEAENSETTTLFAAIHFMLIISGYLSNYFGVPEKKYIYGFFEKMKKLGCKYNYSLREI